MNKKIQVTCLLKNVILFKTLKRLFNNNFFIYFQIM